MLLFSVSAIFVFYITSNQSRGSALEESKSSGNADPQSVQMRQQIANLTAELAKVNKTITRLKMELLKCKKGAPGASLEAADSDSDSKDSEAEDEEQERYQYYLRNFNINDKARRNVWPWSDNTLYYDKLGGENGIQYSSADSAIDSGRAEHYGRDRIFTANDLDDSLNDPQFYGSR